MKCVSKVKVVALAMVLGASMASPIIGVCASKGENTYLLADCPLRKEGWDGGKVLVNMKKNDKIVYYWDQFGSDTEYNKIKHKKTKKTGYVDHNYVYY